jgi:putative flippase GtrA
VTSLAQSVRTVAGHSFTRFAVVGGFCFLVDMLALFLLYGVARVWLPVATLLAYLVAYAVNFVFSRGWVFPAADADRVGRQLARYLLVLAAMLALTVLGVQALVWFSLPYLVAKTATSGVVALLNYAASRWWVFH